ncbi:hypothetical protein [Arthrobacter sp. KNU40]|uniref:hypothetical protein n=1 Tax=Arthrobacter sp. KNU40 TaxID=3447965 RepID=UPI003F5D8420
MATIPTLWLSQNSLFELTRSADRHPVAAWETTGDGKRRPNDRQQLDTAGLPNLEIHCIAQTEIFGRKRETLPIKCMASAAKPSRHAITPLAVFA